VIRKFAVLAVLGSLLTAASLQAAQDIVFRTSVTPEDAWVGQQVLLQVDVLAKDGWAQLKKITETEVQGAYMLRLETQGTRLSETIDGENYTGQRYEFMLFTQRDGDFLVPPVPVDVEVRQYSTGGGPKIHRMSLPGVEFAARMPPGAEGIRGLISATDLTATQSWSTDDGNAIVGDALKRSITLQASDISAMAFTPLLHPEIESVAIYPEQATVEDKFARGDLTGTRVETVTYVFEQTGDVEIPGIALSWWDIRSEQLRRIDLPGLSLRIAANPLMNTAQDGDNAPQPGRQQLWPTLFVLALLAALVLRFGGRLRQHWADWRRSRNESEPAYFRKVMRSSKSGDRKAFIRNTMHWLDRINPASSPARLDDFVQRYGNHQTQEAAIHVMKDLENGQDESTVRDLARGLKASRARWQRSLRAQGKSPGQLPYLNG
jgi:hypothetical protein